MTGPDREKEKGDRGIRHEAFDGFERLVEGSRDAIYHFEIDPGRFSYANRRFGQIFDIEPGTEPSAVLDQMARSIHPEDRARVLNVLKGSLPGDISEGETGYRVISADGGIRHLQDRWVVLRREDGRPRAVQGVVRDSTHRSLTENRFVESHQNALIGNYIVQNGRFAYVNPQFVNITGFSEKELIGRDPMTLVHDDYRDHVRQCAVTMLKGESLTPYEFCVSDKSGATHWVMETVSPIIYRNQPAALGYFMDITQLHRMKDNLSTLGLMLGTISHSLRGCLTGLNAGLYLIEKGFYRDAPAQIEEGLDVAKLMADRIRKLVLDILYYSKERELEIEPIEVRQFARDVAVFVETRIKAADIEFATDFSAAGAQVAIDREMVRTALVNILENAMEACIEDGRPIRHEIRFSVHVDSGHVYFDVADNGPGMDKEQAGRIFQLFHSTKGKRGTGIGLFVTRKAILKHGGNITVESGPDRGTRFRITLPRKPPASVPAA